MGFVGLGKALCATGLQRTRRGSWGLCPAL